MSTSSYCSSSGMIRRMGCPIISAAVKPKSRSAAVFHEVTTPWSVLLTMASSDDAMMAARCARSSSAVSESSRPIAMYRRSASFVPTRLSTPAFSLQAADARAEPRVEHQEERPQHARLDVHGLARREIEIARVLALLPDLIVVEHDAVLAPVGLRDRHDMRGFGNGRRRTMAQPLRVCGRGFGGGFLGRHRFGQLIEAMQAGRIVPIRGAGFDALAQRVRMRIGPCEAHGQTKQRNREGLIVGHAFAPLA